MAISKEVISMVNRIPAFSRSTRLPGIRFMLESRLWRIVKQDSVIAIYYANKKGVENRKATIDVNTGSISYLSKYEFENKGLRNVIPEFLCDPVLFVFNQSRKLGLSCCFCSTPLSDEESVRRGYGPICAEKYCLPYGDVK